MQCNICPRGCNTDRINNIGFCGADSTVKVARASRHMWEEPCISGSNGSGTVFFSGCNLKCVYCQNEKISRGEIGYKLSQNQLKDLFLAINESNVHNINLVTPTHFMPMILEVLEEIKPKLDIPVVCNCSGYESTEMIKRSQGIIDIFLTDIKYFSNDISEKYSFCPNYFEIAVECLSAMLEAAGPVVIENELMRSGVIVRHMILPTHKNDSINVLKELYRRFGNSAFLVSLMNQYTPMPSVASYPEINRRLTALEYKRVAEVYEELGYVGYVQERQSASASYIPDFDDCGEFLSLIIK